MSRRLINLNDDLKALEKDGYEVAVRGGHLVVSNVPYVNARAEVKRGDLVSVLELRGDRTLSPPRQHIAMFAGEHPCDQSGSRLRHIEHSGSRRNLGDGLVVDHSFSAKPKDGYRDYHHKMTTYIEMISSPARKLDPTATAQTYAVAASDDVPSVFRYMDTASTRAGIGAITEKLRMAKVAIVGLGGTGSYVLDLIAKTPVEEIHLFDGDDFFQHNAFRGPGAARFSEISSPKKKVGYWAERYDPLRKGLIQHPVFLDEDNAVLLDEMDFVFLCVDSGAGKRPVVERLEESGKPFIDVGMGVQVAGDQLLGIVRVTTSLPDRRSHFRQHVGLGDAGVDQAYSRNIQIAELNALNASLAVIRWKKLCGFYFDPEDEMTCNYTIDGNVIDNIGRAV
ncbi:ThiF family adenylyltransferase [Mameliella sp. CS4]|uniref:ThiF family adenylyltransferase n=1 Tax=Mameliella sp. CS4 TaxID=2862329 RepID=UPI001C6030F9|nr:ThiF family adenylyltransferase [Mameliella sp. CS4]MBW4985879.1 ThiF family adenylyltransferase [Mameliella sp. CS4]